MPTESELKLARYKQIERESDTVGRVIGVRRLRPSEQGKITEYTAQMNGGEEFAGINGAPVIISHRMQYIVAAMVCEIDSNPVPFPRSRGELDAILDRLDAEGIAAAITAIGRLTATDATVAQSSESAKNSQGTPSSA